MGCDIHPVVQRFNSNTSSWEFVNYRPKEFDDVVAAKKAAKQKPNDRDRDLLWTNPIWSGLKERNYTLFAILGNVRNDGDIIPISEERSFPDLFPLKVPKEFYAYGDLYDDYEDADGFVDLGYHSFSYVMLRELIEYPHWNKPFGIDSYYLTPAEFNKWKFQGSPPHVSLTRLPWPREEYDVTDPAGYACDLYDKTKKVLIEVKAPFTLADCCRNFYDHTIPWLKTLGGPDEVRIVFGFDS